MRRPRIETLLLVAGVALLGWSAVDRARAYVYQARAERELESMIAGAHGAATVDDSPTLPARKREVASSFSGLQGLMPGRNPEGEPAKIGGWVAA